MRREELLAYAKKKFSVNPEYLWKKYPNYAILRKKKTKKWFAVLMDIPKTKLGLQSEEIIDVLNVKCKKDFVAFAKGTKGLYEAYHMNKKTWLCVALDEVDEKLICDLLEQSYELC